MKCLEMDQIQDTCVISGTFLPTVPVKLCYKAFSKWILFSCPTQKQISRILYSKYCLHSTHTTLNSSPSPPHMTIVTKDSSHFSITSFMIVYSSISSLFRASVLQVRTVHFNPYKHLLHVKHLIYSRTPVSMGTISVPLIHGPEILKIFKNKAKHLEIYIFTIYLPELAIRGDGTFSASSPLLPFYVYLLLFSMVFSASTGASLLPFLTSETRGL